MSEPDWDASVVRALLLGRLPEPEVAHIERLLEGDRAFALFFASVEDELVMDYVNHRLEEGERQAFERFYADSSAEHREKIRFARALCASRTRQKQAQRKRDVLAAVALLAIIPWAIWFFQLRTVTTDLYPGIYRGGAQRSVRVGKLTATLRLRLHCRRSYVHAIAAIRADGATKDLLTSAFDAPNGVGFWSIPALVVPPGDYLIQVAPGTADRELFLLSIRK